MRFHSQVQARGLMRECGVTPVFEHQATLPRPLAEAGRRMMHGWSKDMLHHKIGQVAAPFDGPL